MSPRETAGLPYRLGQFVDQLWRPAIDAGLARVSIGGSPLPGWTAAERYLVVPSAARATMLVPSAPRTASVGSLLNYRGLRRPRQNLQRTALGILRGAGVAWPFPVLHVDVPASVGAGSTDASPLPLGMVARALGRDQVFAAMRVNLSSNRKPVLQVVDELGAPVGFAKLAWDHASTRAVVSERRALQSVGGRAGPVRAPALLATGELDGRPYIVSAPIPLDSRSGAGVTPPTPAEIFGLCPLRRSGLIGTTGQLAGLASRLEALPSFQDAGVVGAARELLTTVMGSRVEVPVCARWHGDLTSWNTARDASGTLWCWDWESSDVDAVAGLDAFHWHFAERARLGDLWDGSALRYAFERVAPVLLAAGTPRRSWHLVAALYAVTMVERACHLAAGPVGWEPGWVGPGQLHDLVSAARAMVDQSQGT